jgi:quercetin dioxygenase-like cupin family protein
MSQNVVTQLHVKSHNSPDEKRRPDKAEVDVVTVGDYTIGRFTFEPGWRWSESIKPVAKTDTCQNSHVGFCVSGSLVVETTEGNRINITQGDSYTIPPGHDAWVEGNESFTGIEFLSAATFAKAPE